MAISESEKMIGPGEKAVSMKVSAMAVNLLHQVPRSVPVRQTFRRRREEAPDTERAENAPNTHVPDLLKSRAISCARMLKA
jgi:hypothetical protein